VTDPLLDAALRYARAGLPVLPLGVLTKTPNGRLVPHAIKQATTDEETIRDWWGRVSRCNVGVKPEECVGPDPQEADYHLEGSLDDVPSVHVALIGTVDVLVISASASQGAAGIGCAATSPL